MRKLSLCIAMIALAACAPRPQLPANATPEQVATAKAQQLQANFDAACKWADGAASTAQPLVPLLTPKIGADGSLAVTTLLTAIKTTCGQPLDVNNADAIIQRVYDDAGQVIAQVVKAQTAPAG